MSASKEASVSLYTSLTVARGPCLIFVYLRSSLHLEFDSPLDLTFRTLSTSVDSVQRPQQQRSTLLSTRSERSSTFNFHRILLQSLDTEASRSSLTQMQKQP
jgi:hypothetical protein